MSTYKNRQQGVVIRQEEIAPDVYSMWVHIDGVEHVQPGQFYYIYSGDNAHILGRPISVCDIDVEDSSVRFVYQRKGFGTTECSTHTSGDIIELMGPLGNGFPIDENDSHSLLVGGGMGMAPLLGVARKLKSKAVAVIGYRDKPFMVEDFIDAGCKIIIATESGMTGIKGNVVDALKSEDISSITAYACGPMPMLRAICNYAGEHNIDVYVSLEERMGCGIGACLGCVTPAAKANDHYQVEKLCICKDGPVFHATEVIL